LLNASRQIFKKNKKQKTTCRNSLPIEVELTPTMPSRMSEKKSEENRSVTSFVNFLGW